MLQDGDQDTAADISVAGIAALPQFEGLEFITEDIAANYHTGCRWDEFLIRGSFRARQKTKSSKTLRPLLRGNYYSELKRRTTPGHAVPQLIAFFQWMPGLNSI